MGQATAGGRHSAHAGGRTPCGAAWKPGRGDRAVTYWRRTACRRRQGYLCSASAPCRRTGSCDHTRRARWRRSWGPRRRQRPGRPKPAVPRLRESAFWRGGWWGRDATWGCRGGCCGCPRGSGVAAVESREFCCCWTGRCLLGVWQMLEKGNWGAKLGGDTKQGEGEEAPDAVSSVGPLSGICPRTLTLSRYLGGLDWTGKPARYLGSPVAYCRYNADGHAWLDPWSVKHRQAATSQEELQEPMDHPRPSYRLAQCVPLAVGPRPGTGASGRDGGRRWELGKGRCGHLLHLPAPTTGTYPHEQQWFWIPQTGHNRYDCRYICLLTQYALQCGHKLSDDGLHAMTAPRETRRQGNKETREKAERKRSRHSYFHIAVARRARGQSPSASLNLGPVAYYQVCGHGHLWPWPSIVFALSRKTVSYHDQPRDCTSI